MKMQRKTDARRILLLLGMGLFAVAALCTAINVLALPYARAFYGYSAAWVLAGAAIALAAMLGIGRRIARADEGKLARAARIGVPCYLLALFVIHLAMAYFMEYRPEGDNFMIYTSAQLLARDGNFDAYPDFYLYLSRFSNQWGFMLMLSGLYKLLFALGITQVFFPTAVLQAALYAAGMAAALAIARRLGGVRAALMALAALVLCLPLYLAAAVLYTDTFSLPFVMIALLFALRALDEASVGRQIACALLCALFAAIGGQIKMTAAIVLIAVSIVFVLRLPLLRAALCCAAIWLPMALTVTGVRGAMVGPVLDPAMVAQHNTPTIHWVMMSIPTSRNPYGTDIEDYRQTWTMMEEGAPREDVMETIYTRLKDRIYTLRYPSRLIPAMLRKNAVAFGDGSFGMTEMLDDSPVRENAISAVVLEGRPLYRAYQSLCTGVFMAQMILAGITCARDLRRRDLRAALLYIAAFGLIAFMLLWEVRGRYIFNFVPVFLLLAARAALPMGSGQKEEAE